MPLVTPQRRTVVDPVDAILGALGQNSNIQELEPGILLTGTFSLQLSYEVYDLFDYHNDSEWGKGFIPGTETWYKNHHGFDYPVQNDSIAKRFANIPSYGVVDSPEQFLDDYKKYLVDHADDICVAFVHIAKNPENRGKGGGWRWHKWGFYLGHGEPQYEYLDDEDGFDDGVYVFHVHKLSATIH
jgi:hypothetical protein